MEKLSTIKYAARKYADGNIDKYNDFLCGAKFVLNHIKDASTTGENDLAKHLNILRTIIKLQGR